MPSAGILTDAFRSRAWLDTIDALFDASGLVIGVLDAEGHELVPSTSRCMYCDLAIPEQPGRFSPACFEGEKGNDVAGAWRKGMCHAALPCYIVPVLHAGAVACSVAIGGFVGATRDRRRLFEKLLARGVSQTAAREAVKNIPVLSRREIEAMARLVAVTAEEAIGRAAETHAHAHHARELDLFVETGIAFAEAGGQVEGVLETVLERAMMIVGACGSSLMLLRPGTDILDVAAVSGDAPGHAAGERIHLGEGVPGRVAQNRRSVVVRTDTAPATAEAAGADNSSVASVPLIRDDRLIGVLSLCVPCAAADGLAGEQLALLDRFAVGAAVVIDNARTAQRKDRTMHELTHLSEAAKALSRSSDVTGVVHTAAELLDASFDFEIGGVVVTGWNRDEATVRVVGSVPASALEEVIGEAAGWDLAQTPLTSMNLVTDTGELTTGDDSACEWLTMSAEIMVRDTIVGYLFVASRKARAFDSHDRRLLEGLADHAAYALERAALFERLRDDYMRTISALSAALDAGERAVNVRSDRVMDYAMAIGQQLALPADEVELLRFAGLLHDVGRIGVTEEIVLKPTDLSPEEMLRVRMHAEMGATVVEQIEFLDALTPVILHHHERWDGGGYPQGIAGTDIPLLARILGVADAFDTLMSARSPRGRISFAEARAEMTAASGSQFDPRAVNALFEALDARSLAGATGLLAERPKAQDQLPS